VVRTPPILWRPTDADVARSNISRYRDWLAAECGLDFDGYDRALEMVRRTDGSVMG
jgi:hypothetical protein